jgi:hypothetical protein
MNGCGRQMIHRRQTSLLTLSIDDVSEIQRLSIKQT